MSCLCVYMACLCVYMSLVMSMCLYVSRLCAYVHIDMTYRHIDVTHICACVPVCVLSMCLCAYMCLVSWHLCVSPHVMSPYCNALCVSSSHHKAHLHTSTFTHMSLAHPPHPHDTTWLIQTFLLPIHIYLHTHISLALSSPHHTDTSTVQVTWISIICESAFLMPFFLHKKTKQKTKKRREKR